MILYRDRRIKKGFKIFYSIPFISKFPAEEIGEVVPLFIGYPSVGIDEFSIILEIDFQYLEGPRG